VNLDAEVVLHGSSQGRSTLVRTATNDDKPRQTRTDVVYSQAGVGRVTPGIVKVECQPDSPVKNLTNRRRDRDLPSLGRNEVMLALQLVTKTSS
jgi:hypothetical protein